MTHETLHLRAQRAETLARLITDDGSTASGEVPTDHVAAVDEASHPREVREVERRHREGRGPPSWAGAPDDAGPPDDRGGKGGGPP